LVIVDPSLTQNRHRFVEDDATTFQTSTRVGLAYWIYIPLTYTNGHDKMAEIKVIIYFRNAIAAITPVSG